jgi:hypothetical protein
MLDSLTSHSISVLLTMERYMLLRKPYRKPGSNSSRLSIEQVVLLKICLVLVASILLHCPMTLQNAPKLNPKTGRLVKGNNQQLLCREPAWTLFNYYKMGREFFRFFCVVLLISMNVVIAKSLQMAKKNRRLLIKRASTVDVSGVCEVEKSQKVSVAEMGSRSSKGSGARRDFNSLMRSFTGEERRG